MERGAPADAHDRFQQQIARANHGTFWKRLEKLDALRRQGHNNGNASFPHLSQRTHLTPDLRLVRGRNVLERNGNTRSQMRGTTRHANHQVRGGAAILKLQIVSKHPVSPTETVAEKRGNDLLLAKTRLGAQRNHPGNATTIKEEGREAALRQRGCNGSGRLGFRLGDNLRTRRLRHKTLQALSGH